MIRVYLGIAVVISCIFAYLTALALLDRSKGKRIKNANLRNLMIMILVPVAMHGFFINQNAVYRNIAPFWIGFVICFSFILLITNFIELLAEWIRQKAKYLLLLFYIVIVIASFIIIYGALINRIWIYEHVSQPWTFIVLAFLGIETIYTLLKAVDIIKSLNKQKLAEIILKSKTNAKFFDAEQ